MRFIGLFALVSVFSIGVFFIPTPTHAQDLASFAGCSGPDCSACNIVDLTNGLIQWLIGFLFILFAIIMAYAGFGLVTSGGNGHALDEAKGRFTNAVIGLIIVLAAWLIVDTIMRGLVGRPNAEGMISTGGEVSGWLFWSEVRCAEQPHDSLANVDYVPENFEPEIGGVFVAHTMESIAIVPGATGGPIVGVPAPTGSGANCPVPPASNMVPIPGQTSFSALPSTVQNFVAMRQAAAADGITLRVSSAYRSEAQQVEIWVRKGCDKNPALCKSKAARPCSYGGNGSNHNSGRALDISGSSMNSPTYNWLKRNGGRYGFYNNLGAPDPIHWSPSGR